MQFGTHVPTEVKDRGLQSPMAVFSRGLQSPGTQWRFAFDNGFGASVISDGYGAEQGLFELAVFDGDHLTYETPLTDDVLGFLSAEEVTKNLDAIAALDREAIKRWRLDLRREEIESKVADLQAELAALEVESTR